MIKYIAGKFKKGFTIVELMIVVGLVAFLAVYSGLEMSRKATDNDVARMRTHVSYITAGIDNLYGTTASVDSPTLVNIATLCDGNYILPSICTGSTANAEGGAGSGFSGLSVDPIYTVVGASDTTATITVTVGNEATAKALKASIDAAAIQGTAVTGIAADVVTLTFTVATS